MSAGATIAIAAGVRAAIELDSPMTMAGTITGFGAGDTIDLKRVTVKLANYANGVLSLFGQSPYGYPQVASLAIPMPFATPAFTLSSDHDGGTDVKFAPAAPPTIAAPAAKTVTAKAVTPIAGLSIADNAAATAGQTLTVTLTDKKGLLSASAIGGGAVTGAGTEALTITGSLGEVNSDLATLTYVESKAGTDRITIGAMNSGGGIAKSQNVAITITAAPASLNPALFIQAIAAFGATEAWLTGRADGLALEQRHLDLSVRP